MSIDNDEQLAPEITVLNQPYYAPIDNGVLALMAIIHVCNSKKYACDKGDLGMALKTEMDFFKLGKLNILTLPAKPLQNLFTADILLPKHLQPAKDLKSIRPALLILSATRICLLWAFQTI